MAKRNHRTATALPDAPQKVWDGATRIFHWTLASLVALSWFSADRGFMKIHLWSGLSVLTLLLFRLAWGIVGSTTARFSHFLQSPGAALDYLSSLRNGRKPLYAGHNPAGGWMVIALLAILAAQVGTGLFSNDGLHFNGPLAFWVSADTSDRLTALHGVIFNFILLLIWLHVVAVFFYFFVKRENLILPMITGHKQAEHVPPRLRLDFMHGAIALGIFAAIAGAVCWLLGIG